jgi:phosphatidate cytidylyltransferase
LKNITKEIVVLEGFELMKARLLTAAVAVPLLLVVLFFLPSWVLAWVIGIFCAIAAYELLHRTKLVRHMRMVAYSALAALLVPVFGHYGISEAWALLAVVGYVSLLFMEVLLSRGKIRIQKLALCLMAGLVIPYAFSAIVRIMDGDLGRHLVLTPFVLAFIPDSGAYFVGIKHGKTKLAPSISPKKSVEGAISGILTGMIGMVAFMLVLQIGFDLRINYLFALIYGLVGSVAAIFGDLCFSVIKRQTEVKDYGVILPGHGGILDRFDSMMFVAPLTEALLVLIPVAWM